MNRAAARFDRCAPLARRARRDAGLAWPLILSNLTMAAIQATDVVLMGWLGARPLAAVGAGAQPQLRLQPDLPRPGHRLVADDGDRAGGQAPVGPRSAADLPPILLDGRDRHAAGVADPVELRSRSSWRSGRSRRWPATPSPSSTAICGRCCPSCCSRRCAISSPRWSGRAGCWRSASVGIVLNALLGYGLIFGHFGLPALGHLRRRAGQLDRLGAAGGAAGAGHRHRPPVPPLPSVRPLLAARLAALPQAVEARPADRPRHGVRRRRVQRRRLSDGPDQRRIRSRPMPSRCRSRRLSFMVPWGLSQAATVRVGLFLGARRPRRHHARRLDGLGAWASASWR